MINTRVTAMITPPITIIVPAIITLCRASLTTSTEVSRE